MCNYVADEKNYVHLQSYILPEYNNGVTYTDKMKLADNTLGTEVMTFATVQMTSNDIVIYINGWCKQHCANGTFKKHTKNALYLCNSENRHLYHITLF